MHTDTLPHLAERTLPFRVAHAAFRRDADRLVRATSRVAGSDDAAAVLAWFDRFESVLNHHHEIEDDIWWPLLSSAVDGFAGTEAGMVHEHSQLVATLVTVRLELTALATADPGDRSEARQRATAAAVTLARALADHLDAEEAAVFPVLAAAPQDTITTAKKKSAKRDSLGLVRFALPWALDDIDPDLASEVRATLPRMLRPVLRRWDRRYRRTYARFFALSA